MSLRSQVGLLLVAIATAFVALTHCIQVFVVIPAFADLERKGAIRDLDRFVDAIGREEELLSHATLDWSAWDDLYSFVQEPNERFQQATLNDEAFKHAHVNLIYILDTEHKVVWGDIRDIENDRRLSAPDLVSTLETENPQLNIFKDVDDKHGGLLSTSLGPMLFAMRPIVTSEGLGPIRGAIMFGRLLTPQELAGIAGRTHLALDAWRLDQESTGNIDPSIISKLPKAGEKFIEADDTSTMSAYTVLNDTFGKPFLLFQARLPRDITAQGRVSAYTATGCGLAAAIVTIVLIWGVLQWRVVYPLMNMATHAQLIGQMDDLKSRLNVNRNDEIGAMARAFDEMVANLAESRKEILDSAHQAGMAEIASEVLHNIGNAVTSANCSIECLEQRIAESRTAGLDRVTKMLQEQLPRAAEFFTTDPRGPKLVEYLVQLNDCLRDEGVKNAAEVKRLRSTVRHIRDVISAQQEFAKRVDFRQEVDLATLVNEVLQLNSHGIRCAEIKTHIDLPWMPELYISKSKTTQVLVNLVRNAIQAMQSQDSGMRCLIICGRLVDGSDLELEVTDTGCGFDAEVQQKLFSHGFTTKREGHGIGLHYCANSIRESGGSVTAQSPGPGQGATFRIRIPNVLRHDTPILA